MNDRPRGARDGPGPAGGGTWGLGLLFGTIYFVQGVGEPTEGLIAQPVRSLLKSWGRGDGDITAFVALLALPWSLKPLFGLLTDFVPLAGSRRRSYLIATSGATVLGLGAAGLAPLPTGSAGLLLALLLVPTVAVAFSDVVADALMVERGQPLGLTGRLQAIQWASMYAATIVTGVAGGYLSRRGWQRAGFLACAALSAVTLLLAIGFVRERPARPAAGGLGDAVRALGRVARSPTVLGVGAFLFLWNFNPFQATVLYLHMSRELGFDEQFCGNTTAILAVGSIAASLAYGLYCRRVPMPRLVHASIALGVASTLAYWGMADKPSAAAVALIVGFTYMTATLIQLDLAARACPPEVAGTVFALLMSLENLATALSTWLGGAWYERGKALWGARGSFHVLVGVGAAFTAACWLLIPLLPRGLGRSDPGHPAGGPGPTSH